MPMWCTLLLSVLTLSLGGGGMQAMASPLLDVCNGPDGYKDKYKHTVYVDPSAATVNCDLQPPTVTITCPDINTALAKNAHRSSTAFVLTSAPNVTHILKLGAQNFLQELTEVGFFGESISNLARVECEDGAGLAFWNVDRIRLENVEFSFCGALRNTTSKKFDQNTLLKVKAGLYFYNGTNVTMCHVTVQHGPYSLGVLMYDTDGIISIYHSNFVNNSVPNNKKITGGGGIYVEFSYCVPGYEKCRKQLTHIANSNHVFYNCTFVNNSAAMKNTVRLVTRYNNHIGIGEGGGLALFLFNATKNMFQIIDCLFKGNRAFFGGAIYVSFENTTIGNTVLVDKTVFNNNMCNTAYGSGGALRVYSALNYHNSSLIDRKVKGNSVRVTASNFTENQALQGGGIAFSPTYQTSLVKEQATHLSIANCTFTANHAQLGAAIYTGLNPFFVFGTINDVNIRDCIFKNNSIYYELEEPSHDVGIGTVYTSQVPLIFTSSVEFLSNTGSALAVTGSYANFYDTNATFLSNEGDTGGAIALLGSAYAIVNENTNMYFGNNFARKGGAIYNMITGRGAVESSRTCFILNSYTLDEKKASFTFDNNISINNTSNSIYTTSAYPCARGNTDITMNLTKTLRFCNNTNWKFVNSTCIKEIQTEGDSYKFTNKSTIFSFPGMGFDLPVHVYDDLDHNITNSTGYTSTVPPDQPAQVDPRFSLTSNNYVRIVGQENTTVKLELQSTGLRPHYLSLEVKLLQCPPGLYFETTTSDSLGKCVCNSTLSFGNALSCSTDNFEASIPLTSWIGHDPTGLREGELVMGEVPDLYSKQESETVHYQMLPKSYSELDKVVCGNKNRTGTLCGQCKGNFSTSVNTYNYICTPCDDDTDFVKNIFIFIASSYLPYIILLGAMAHFNLKLTSSATNGFILYAQLMSVDIFDTTGSTGLISRMHKAIYGIFNFNSFANYVVDPFCIHKNWTTLDVLCLEYTLAGLPIILTLLLYLLLRFKSIKFLCCRKERNPLSIQASESPRITQRYRKKNESSPSSLIHTLVVFILLSYTKLILVSMKILAVQKLFDGEHNYLSDPRVYLAGHLSFFSKEYLLPYGAVAIFMMLFFALIPPLFLLGMPQLIDRLLDTGKFPRFKRLWPTVTINIFLDAFQGFYKPELYCRIFAGLYFVFRLVIVFLYVVTSDYLITYFWQQFFIVLMIVLLAIGQPYKKRIFNILDILIFLNLAVVNMISEYVYTSSLTVAGLTEDVKTVIFIFQYVLIWLPLAYMLSYVIYKLLAKVGITRWLRAVCMGTKLAMYFNVRASKSQQSAQSQSEDEEDDRDTDTRSMLTDSALFSRAETSNKYRSPAERQGNPTKLWWM